MPTPLFPFSNDYFEEVSEQELQKHFEAKKDLAGIMMEYFGQNENEKIVAPDTAGVDYYFLEDFLTANMEIDFALIEQDFLKNCKDRLMILVYLVQASCNTRTSVPQLSGQGFY